MRSGLYIITKSRATDNPLAFSIVGMTIFSVVPGGTLGLSDTTSPFFSPLPIELATEITALRSADKSFERTGTQIILKYDLLEASTGSEDTSNRWFFSPSL